MNTIKLTDQELRDISHALDAAVEDAEHYLKHYVGDCEEDVEEAILTMERWRVLAQKFDELYPHPTRFLTAEGL